MREQLNDQDMEMVVGGTVRLNTTRMQISFTTIKKVFKLKNCEDTDAMALVSQLYGQYKNAGDKAYEEATLAAFQSRGWI